MIIGNFNLTLISRINIAYYAKPTRFQQERKSNIEDKPRMDSKINGSKSTEGTTNGITPPLAGGGTAKPPRSIKHNKHQPGRQTLHEGHKEVVSEDGCALVAQNQECKQLAVMKNAPIISGGMRKQK